jgi:hypothetical protein
VALSRKNKILKNLRCGALQGKDAKGAKGKDAAKKKK